MICVCLVVSYVAYLCFFGDQLFYSEVSAIDIGLLKTTYLRPILTYLLIYDAIEASRYFCRPLNVV